ncbi:hypothetical protein BGW42_000113 [Actinomortierella wolfii]|nr:hypothetical protein BGW42_000113 [Actinomortierella wolfii]
MSTIEDLVEAIRGKNLERRLECEKPKKYELVFLGDAPQGMSFRFLGNGANKTVYEVLLNSKSTGMRKDEMDDIVKETDILYRLSQEGVRVPRPFQSPEKNFMTHVHLSNDEDGDEVDGSVFFMEYLDIGKLGDPGRRYYEMQKLEAPANFMKQILDNVQSAKSRRGFTLEQVEKIRGAYEKDPWADFQVLYDTKDGGLMVFDPSPEIHGIDKKKVFGILDQWKADLESASEI